MNSEKIRELAERADLQFVVKVNDNNEDIVCVEGDDGYPTAEQFKKFAELIIAKCSDICYTLHETEANPRDHNGGACGYEIDKYFGRVE